MDYPPIPGTASLPYKVAPPHNSLSSLPTGLTTPASLEPNSKSIYAFWNTGIHNLPPNLLRNVLAWHRRLSPLGWKVYVFNTVQDSPLNISNFIDTTSKNVVPDAFRDGTLGGGYQAQHTSDLIRFPLLLKYGGVYMDVGILLFGDLDKLWTEHITNPKSPIDFSGFTMSEFPEISIVNFAMMCGPNNPLIRRAHYILLKLWEGKTDTTGMHKHPLVNHIPLMRVPPDLVIEAGSADKMAINDESMTDYAIQIQCMGAAQRWVDPTDGWDGPKYVREKCHLFSMMAHSYAHEQLTSWDGALQHRLFMLPLPNQGEKESEDQKLARRMVEEVVGKSWCLKLGHGFSAKLFGGDTLGIRWRKNPGTDCVEGTYGGWLRWAEGNVGQETLLERIDVGDYEPTMKGTLMDGSW
ncbi:hypothetical protein CC80DRAFT_453099 [Byssothecium circinans]|uniref:Capsule polysaccharide biosynthesis protein n=1 Tax=Byssothecium circinans TaxID=147558 RepID=A0A6A5TK25_9PLEO|nr:hypothetical protein CC80DRAFT_453099 [Byssothecium circinans]